MGEYNQSYIKAKVDKAREKFGLTGQTAPGRLPPGQFLTTQFPILDLGERPPLELKDFTLHIFGEVENEVTLTSQEFLALPTKEIVCDFHCVTRWSRYDLKWQGVSFAEIVKLAKPRPTTKFVVFGSRDGYTTNVPLADCLRDNVLVAFKLDGSDIPLLHGGPIRMIIPHLYGWKSAKFLNAIKFVQQDEPGFWETRGYHNHGDPWLEERYS